MTKPFGQWTARIDAAGDDKARRELLGEIGLWRATRLTDIPAQRSASYALSRLYLDLGELPQAAHEAQQLLALCRTAPEAVREERQLADKHARRVERAGQPAGARKGRERGGRGSDEAVEAAAAGDWARAQELARGRGPRAELFRSYVSLRAALALEGEGRDAALLALAERLERQVMPGSAPESSDAPARSADQGDSSSPLASLLGRPVPRRRDPFVNALEAHLAEHADQVDELAAAALRHHVAQAGLKATAPWLIGFVGQALAAGEAKATRAALNELSAQGAYAVTAYDESPFRTLVGAWKALSAAGAGFVALRRGVDRSERGNRRLWTLRVRFDDGERLVVVGPASRDPYSDEQAAQLARRITELGSTSVVMAPGAGYAGFRAACAALGLKVFDEATPEQLSEAATKAGPLAETGRRSRSERAPREQNAASDTPRERAPRAADVTDAISALFAADPPSAAEAYAEPLGALRRVFRAFIAIREPMAAMSEAEADVRLPAFLQAVHAAAPASVRLSEGSSVALQIAAACPGGQVETLLSGDPEIFARFAGPGFTGLLEVVRGVAANAGNVHRTLRGVTRRERRDNPALDALGDATGGLWRLVVRTANGEGEIWWLSDLSVEAEAAVPQLAAGDRPRLVLVAPDQGLEERVGASGLVKPVTFTGDPAPIAEAMASWSAQSEDAPAAPEAAPEA